MASTPIGKASDAEAAVGGAVADAMSKAAKDAMGAAAEKAMTLLKSGAGDISVYIEKNHYSINVLSFMGGAALSAVSFLGLLNFFGVLFGPLNYVLKLYQLVFGLTICAIDGPNDKIPRVQAFIVQYTPVLHNNLGRSLFYLFIASLEGTQDSWIHMIVGWYFFGISLMFIALKAKSLCGPTVPASAGDDLEAGDLKQMQVRTGNLGVGGFAVSRDARGSTSFPKRREYGLSARASGPGPSVESGGLSVCTWQALARRARTAPAQVWLQGGNAGATRSRGVGESTRAGGRACRGGETVGGLMVLVALFWLVYVRFAPGLATLVLASDDDNLGVHENKCLQVAVAKLRRGRRRRDAMRFFETQCQNDVGSGEAGAGSVGKENLIAVERWLHKQQAFVWVYEGRYASGLMEDAPWRLSMARGAVDKTAVQGRDSVRDARGSGDRGAADRHAGAPRDDVPSRLGSCGQTRERDPGSETEGWDIAAEPRAGSAAGLARGPETTGAVTGDACEAAPDHFPPRKARGRQRDEDGLSDDAHVSLTALPGLQNPKWHCFMSASAQALFAVPDARAAVRTAGGARSADWEWWRFAARGNVAQRSRRAPDFDGLLACTLRAMESRAGPKPMMLKAMERVFYNSTQEDANEFLQDLLDAERAPTVSSLFRMEKTETLVCGRKGRGGAQEVKGDRHLTCLTVRVLAGGVTSVQEAIQQSSAGELMESDFRWSCPKGCGWATAVKGWELTKFPQVLWVHVGAQTYDRESRRAMKVPHTIVPNAEVIVGEHHYELASCVVHHGEGFRTGHYTAICRATAGGDVRWELRDDECVKMCPHPSDARGWKSCRDSSLHMLMCVRTGPSPAPGNSAHGSGAADRASETACRASGAQSETQGDRAGDCGDDAETMAQSLRRSEASEKNVGVNEAGVRSGSATATGGGGGEAADVESLATTGPATSSMRSLGVGVESGPESRNPGPATAADVHGGARGDAVDREAPGRIETPEADEAQEWFFAARVILDSQVPRRNREKAAAEAAELLRESPGASGDLGDPSVPWAEALAEDSAVELPAAHCAFRGCRWSGNAEAELIEHVAAGHGEVLQPIADTHSPAHEESERILAAHSEVVSQKTRQAGSAGRAGPAASAAACDCLPLAVAAAASRATTPAVASSPAARGAPCCRGGGAAAVWAGGAEPARGRARGVEVVIVLVVAVANWPPWMIEDDDARAQVLTALFVVGLFVVALEDFLDVNKSSVMLIMSATMWAFLAVGYHPTRSEAGYLQLHEELSKGIQDVGSVILFLLPAMGVVESIDHLDGFVVVTVWIRRLMGCNRERLIPIITVLTFFLSAVIDNLTSTIVALKILRHFSAQAPGGCPPSPYVVVVVFVVVFVVIVLFLVLLLLLLLV
ncbi:unnamed protein product, partial [Prorocentrum cordatum]